ncbi:MAG: nicotinamide riboside transporter PnuC [Oscillospiraceae bacterium]|nr:nicotinamide riboside transporter PnuC [Oscillospiraceae bacterium]
MKHYFSRTETALWCGSVILITAAFLLFDRENYLTLAASLIGTTSLILNAKGNPAGQVLIVIFSVIYGVISFNFTYYGEMITYLGMTAPMSVAALISWLKNPYGGSRAEVRVNRVHRREAVLMLVLTAAVTVGFYFILRAFGTANLLPSTLSVTTSFLAVYLTFRRSAFFALAYAANDLILIFLWTLAALEDKSYVSVIVCFVIFFVNDIYGFISWTRMYKRQNGRERDTALH